VKISILVPCYNEKDYILEVLKNINKQKDFFNLEIIISDDCSNDGTLQILENNKNLYDKIITSKKNLGKGHAIKNAINFITGDVVIIQDADLEYSPNDYEKIIEPFLNNNADVVYGSRFQGSSKKRIIYFKNKVANVIITFICNLMTNLNFSDVETGFKAFKVDLLKKINLKENTFSFEIEVTMKISKFKVKIYEVGISYNGRTVEEGKKIKFIDGLKAIYSIFKYKFFN
jgi:glycosyltransferase involved in cell wall biosynthesis